MWPNRPASPDAQGRKSWRKRAELRSVQNRRLKRSRARARQRGRSTRCSERSCVRPCYGCAGSFRRSTMGGSAASHWPREIPGALQLARSFRLVSHRSGARF
eukprot:scaffold1247_cov251-Pinguiococcus_pyrenoidosus.AAC.25